VLVKKILLPMSLAAVEDQCKFGVYFEKMMNMMIIWLISTTCNDVLRDSVEFHVMHLANINLCYFGKSLYGYIKYDLRGHLAKYLCNNMKLLPTSLSLLHLIDSHLLMYPLWELSDVDFVIL
jgi:hypothetical protein